MLLTALLAPAFAGERTFAFSYGYGTVPAGGVEIEHYLTMAEKEGGTVRKWEHQVELEYGITDKLEAGLYVTAVSLDEGAMEFAHYKARLRYRLGSQGVWPVDVGLYAEYIGSPTFEEHGFEAKILLGKEVGKFVSAMDLEYKLEVEKGALVHEVEPTLGLGYRVAPWVTLGAEGKMEVEVEGSEVEGPLLWGGPSVHLAGKGGRLWWTFAVLAPLTGDTVAADGFVARSLLAINL